jgi:photosystem II stability/assembly factor-like uncharacterized protein
MLKVVYLSTLIAIVAIACGKFSQADGYKGKLPEYRNDLVWQIEESKINYNGKFNVIRFLDEQTGWIGGDEGLYKTTNAGKTWEKVNFELPNKSRITHIDFSDSLHGWIIVQSIIPLEEEQQAQIMSTQDGGLSWHSQFSVKNTRITDMRFTSNNEGWVVGVKKVAESSWESFVLHYDKNFEELRVDFCTNLSRERVIGCRDFPELIVSAESNRLSLVTNKRKLFQSDDKGVTWRKKAEFENTDAQAVINAGGMNDDQQIWFLEGANTVIEGTRGRLTVNGGKTFLFNTYFAKAVYLFKDSLIVSGLEVKTPYDKNTGKYQRTEAAVILATKDNGKNWKEIYRNPNLDVIESLSLVKGNKLEVWGLTKSGSIVHLFEKTD